MSSISSIPACITASCCASLTYLRTHLRSRSTCLESACFASTTNRMLWCMIFYLMIYCQNYSQFLHYTMRYEIITISSISNSKGRNLLFSNNILSDFHYLVQIESVFQIQGFYWSQNSNSNRRFCYSIYTVEIYNLFVLYKCLQNLIPPTACKIQEKSDKAESWILNFVNQKLNGWYIYITITLQSHCWTYLQVRVSTGYVRIPGPINHCFLGLQALR